MSLSSLSSPLAEAWSKSDTLTSRASKGKLTIIPNKSITREDLITNEELMAPVFKHLGLRTTIDSISEHVEIFMYWAGPRGKNQVSRPSTAHQYFNTIKYTICHCLTFDALMVP